MKSSRLLLRADLVRRARRRAWTGSYDGTLRTADYLARCSIVQRRDPFFHRLIFTRDEGMHTCGWWKNPDYERCFHLSLSFVDAESGEDAPQQHDEARAWCLAFFGDDARLVWVEPPYSEEGKRCDVTHYRLFCDPAWKAILPRGEVYTREFTECGWQSFSDRWNPHLIGMEGDR